MGKFDTLREVVEDMTGLCADFQIVLRDTVLRDMIDRLADGKLDIIVLEELYIQPFRLDRKEIGPGYIPSGPQQMNTEQVMRYILAEEQNPKGKIHERSYRKNFAQEALIRKIKNQLKNLPLLGQIDYTKRIFDFFNQEREAGNIEIDFDPNLISNILKSISNLARSVVLNFGQPIDADMPDIQVTKQHIFHDQYFGDGGVTRVHNLENFPDDLSRKDSQSIKQDIAAGTMPGYILIPDGGDPIALDLPKNYWQAIRNLVKQRLLTP